MFMLSCWQLCPQAYFAEAPEKRNAEEEEQARKSMHSHLIGFSELRATSDEIRRSQ